MSNFTDEEKKLLSQYVTDTEGDSFAIKNLNGIAGAVYARYSRAKTGFRETLLKEFIEEGQIDPVHADKLIERILVAYGDDSVGELEGIHFSFENISFLATKEIEDRRIGGSPIEKSSRYVLFNEKDSEGKYKYYRDPSIMASEFGKDYEETLDFVFDTYNSLVEPMQAFYLNRFPVEEAMYDVLGTGQKQKLSELTNDKDKKAFTMTYNMDQKTKACDTLRCLLPVATKTNVGLFGNGRFYQMLISHLLSSPLEEIRSLGRAAFTEISKVLPQYVRRGKEKVYNMAIEKNMDALTKTLLSNIPVTETQPATLAPLEWRNSEDFLIAHMLYGYTRHPLTQIYAFVQTLSNEQKETIKTTYVGERKTRRDRPGRAFECGYQYTFDLLADFGTYKDLERHRMTSQIRQPFSPVHGFEHPKDIVAAGFEEKVNACHERVSALYEKLVPRVGEQAAAYITLQGHRVRWIMSFNDREAMHLLELRTTPQGHPQYRRLCQLMHEEIIKQDPWRAKIMSFVDHNDYTSARGDSEARQRVKEKQLEEKYQSSSQS